MRGEPGSARIIAVAPAPSPGVEFQTPVFPSPDGSDTAFQGIYLRRKAGGGDHRARASENLGVQTGGGWPMSTLLRAGLLATCLAAAIGAAPGPVRADPITTQDLVKAQDNAGEWLMYGRDYRNWRYSPLSEITPENAGQLKPTWAMSTGGTFGGLEATPLYRAGVLYFSADYGRIFAVDARTGTIIWHYEPKYDDNFSAMLCCGPIHRGVALKDD